MKKKIKDYLKKIKEYYNKFKELWSVPRYRAIIKLSIYAFMFIVIFSLASVFNNANSNDTNSEKSYAEILDATDVENLDIKYNIKVMNSSYIIEGEINNNILNGYIENNGSIKKIKIKENTIYNIINNVEAIDEELNNLLIKDFLLPKNIIELTTNEAAYIEKGEKNSIYTYEVNYNNINYEIRLTTNLENLTNITISNDTINYNLEIIFDKI